MNASCTCSLAWGAVIPQPPCPVHPERVIPSTWPAIGLAFLLVLSAAPASPAELLVTLQKQAVVYPPGGGTPIVIPAGAELFACEDANGSALVYDISGRAVSLPNPCAEQPLFKDSFE